MANSKNAPLYQQIFEEIKSAIEEGVYAPKERIPSEPELAAQYGVSRITVRRAVEDLCAEGYLVKQQGRGTFVSTPHINRRLLQYTVARSFTDVCRDNEMAPGAHVINRLIVPVRSEEAKFFGLDEQALLLYIQRVRTRTGSRSSRRTSSCPMRGIRSCSRWTSRTCLCLIRSPRSGDAARSARPSARSRRSGPRRSRRRGWSIFGGGPLAVPECLLCR